MVVHSSTKIFQIGCLIALLLSSASTLDAVTVADVVTRLGGLNAQHKREVLVKGAQAEGELVCYGTILVNEFGALGKVFNARYPFINLKHYFARARTC